MPGERKRVRRTGIMVQTEDGVEYRSVIAGANVTVTNPDGVDGPITVAATGGGGGGAPTGASYLVLGLDGTLSAERRLQLGTGLSATDGGAGGDFTISPALDLAALEGLTGTGLAVRTGTSTWTTRTLGAPAAGLTISNADGVAGAPTLALADDLAAVEGLGGTGLAVRTGVSSWTTRSIVNGAGITVTNGDGVAGDITIAATGGGGGLSAAQVAARAIWGV